MLYIPFKHSTFFQFVCLSDERASLNKEKLLLIPEFRKKPGFLSERSRNSPLAAHLELKNKLKRKIQYQKKLFANSMSNNNIFDNNESTIKDSVSEIGRHEKNNSENKILDLTQNLKKKFALKFNTMRAVTKNSALDIDIRDKSKFLMSRMNWLIVLKDIYESS